MIKKRSPSGGLTQVATMTVIKGRSTLDCKLVEDISDTSSGAALQIDGLEAKVELTMGLLHLRLEHSGNGAMQKLLKCKGAICGKRHC